MSRSYHGSSESLVLLAAAVSLQLAQGRDAETLGLMSAFFSVLGDSLALYALQLPGQSENTGRVVTPP